MSASVQNVCYIKSMKHKTPDTKQPSLLLLGFALLFPGIFLATIFDGSWTLRVIGIVLILVASATFGASISIPMRHKK